MYKKSVLVIIFFIHTLYSKPQADFQLSVGPAWHRYNFNQIFIFSSHLPAIDFRHVANEFRSEYCLMPYIQGKMNVLFNKYFNTTLFVGTGTLKRGGGTTIPLVSVVINEPLFSILTPGLLSARVHSKIIISDFGIGCKIPIKNSFVLNPLGGYTYNKQQPILNCLATTITYSFKNIWQGPYLGLELSGKILPNVKVSSSYKFVFAHLKSDLLVTQKTPIEGQGEGLFFFSDSTHATNTACAHGNIFNISLSYITPKNVLLGTGLSFLQYKNSKQGIVHLGPYNITKPGETETALKITGSRMSASWQQIMWTFDFDICF